MKTFVWTVLIILAVIVMAAFLALIAPREAKGAELKAPPSSSAKADCNKKTKRHVLRHRKHRAAPKRAPVRVFDPTAYASVIPTHQEPSLAGCVEIRLPAMRDKDIGVKGYFAGSDLSKQDQCFGLKASTDADFRALGDDLCLKENPIVCDFARESKVGGQPLQRRFSFYTKPGVAYTLRLPASVAADSSLSATVVGIVRAHLVEAPGTTKAYHEAIRYGSVHLAMMAIIPSCYENGVADVLYSKSDITPETYCRAYLEVPRADWKGP